MKNNILKLVNSLEFQELKSYFSKKTISNAALNADLFENLHSEFIAWWLNPKSDHGLGDAPLKLFLRLAATKSLGEATFGIDGFDGAFHNRVLTGNYNVKLLENTVLTALELSYEEDGDTHRRVIPVVMEYQISDNDGNGLTERYVKAVTSYPQVEDAELSPMGILLTEEPTQPSCSQFDNITYQELLTYVIKPLVSKADSDSESQKDKNIQLVTDNNREIIDTAFSSLYRPSEVEKIVDGNSKVLDTTDAEINILRMLWDENEAVFEAVIYHLYKEHQATLDKLFASSEKDDVKYTVTHNGKAIFPGKSLSKAMTACAIFKAYLEEYPATTLDELQKAFPCEELNDYYYDRFYNDLFYCSDPDNIGCSGEQVLPRTGGKNIGSETLAKWDFYLADEQLLPIENGTQKAMCVKIWRKHDFGRLIKLVHDKGCDRFITIEVC